MKKENIQLPTNKSFGIFFSLVFFLTFCYFLFYEKFLLSNIFLILSLLLLFVSFFIPSKLLFLNKMWMKFGLLLSKIISPIILGLIFFLIFTTVSLIFKLVGRDELRLKNKKHDTFWISKQNSSLNELSFKRQF